MIKQDIFGSDARGRLESGARDRLYSFILEAVNVRGALLHGTNLVREMRANHGLDRLATMLLGHGYLAAGLLSANLKGDDRIGIRVECDGPVKGLSVEANALGEVRGFLFQPGMDVPESFDGTDLSPLWGEGSLSLTRRPAGGGEPFVGRIELGRGSLAINLANYYLVSEQTPTAFDLSVKFDKAGQVAGAGALFLQALPGAAAEALSELEQSLAGLPSIGSAFAAGIVPEDLLDGSFGKYFPSILESRRVEFFCRCSAESFKTFIAALPSDELDELAGNGPFPLVTICHNCGSSYEMTRAELRELLDRRRGSNPG